MNTIKDWYLLCLFSVAMIFTGTGYFEDIDGTELVYTSDLEDSQSEIFQEYSNLIEGKVSLGLNGIIIFHCTVS